PPRPKFESEQTGENGLPVLDEDPTPPMRPRARTGFARSLHGPGRGRASRAPARRAKTRLARSCMRLIGNGSGREPIACQTRLRTHRVSDADPTQIPRESDA